MKVNIVLIELCAALLCGNGMVAHVNKVHSEVQFYRTINKRSIAISFFYQDDKETRKDLRLKGTMNAALAALERMSRLPWYDDGDCIFVTVNVVTDELLSLMRSFGITKLPIYMLFYNSVPVKDEQGNLARLSGFAPRDVLESFIDRYAGGTIEDTVKDRAKQRRIAREDARLRYEYYAPYFYWGYPYWGGWGGCPGFGFSMGVGCGY